MSKGAAAKGIVVSGLPLPAVEIIAIVAVAQSQHRENGAIKRRIAARHHVVMQPLGPIRRLPHALSRSDHKQDILRRQPGGVIIRRLHQFDVAPKLCHSIEQLLGHLQRVAGFRGGQYRDVTPP